MEIKFELVSEKEIKVIGIEENEEKQIGSIFTPASSSRDITNAIQVCGLSEIYDYWGCYNYNEREDFYDVKRAIIKELQNKKQGYVQMKDIQIMFEFGTQKRVEIDNTKEECWGCFNSPCTCDNKGNHKHISPYNVKREEDLKDKLEYINKEEFGGLTEEELRGL